MDQGDRKRRQSHRVSAVFFLPDSPPVEVRNRLRNGFHFRKRYLPARLWRNPSSALFRAIDIRKNLAILLVFRRKGIRTANYLRSPFLFLPRSFHARIPDSRNIPIRASCRAKKRTVDQGKGFSRTFSPQSGNLPASCSRHPPKREISFRGPRSCTGVSSIGR